MSVWEGTILITGGAGFVGANLAIGIKQHRPDTCIIALDNLKRRGSELNVPRLMEHGVRFLHGDVRNPDDLRIPDSEISLIIECSAEPSVLAGYNGGHRYMVQSNLVGALHCFDLATRHGAGVIFLSTSRVYPYRRINQLRWHEASTRFELSDVPDMQGVSHRGISEQFPLDGQRSLYGATKLSAELLLHEYGAQFQIPYIINRCGVLAGPWQMGKVDQGVCTLWMAAHVFGRPLRYIGFGGSGKQVRDVLHIEDLLKLILLQMDDLQIWNGAVYNVGGGSPNSRSLQELTTLCRQITGNHIPIESDPDNRPGDVIWYVTDNSTVQQKCGWHPDHSVEKIMLDIYQWIRQQEQQVKIYLT